MCFGSEMERLHLGECRTMDDVRLLFERYRAEARHFERLADPDEPDERDPDRERDPVLDPTFVVSR